MKIGIMFSGIGGRNGADFVAEFMINAVRELGHECVALGSHGGPQVEEIPDGLDFVVHSSGRHLRANLVEKFRKKTKVFLWTHNDEMQDWQQVISPISLLVDIHYSYTKAHPYGKHVRFLPLAADHTVYHPLHPDYAYYDYDVAMIGARREWRETFAQEIQKSFPRSFFHFDMGLSHAEVNSVYNRTKVVLAPVQDCDQDLPAHAWGCPCRTYDVPASGAFQIQVFRDGLPSVYPYATSILPIRNVKDAVAQWTQEVKYWIREEDHRLSRASYLYHTTLNRHLYIHRIQTMIIAAEKLSMITAPEEL